VESDDCCVAVVGSSLEGVEFDDSVVVETDGDEFSPTEVTVGVGVGEGLFVDGGGGGGGELEGVGDGASALVLEV
jgi:hypothetical protein